MELLCVIIQLLPLIICCFLTLTCNTSSVTDVVDYRLTDKIMPSHYDLRLEPYLLESDGTKRFTFNGIVRITIRTNQLNQRRITLHAENINITDTQLFEALNENKQIQIIERFELDKYTDKLQIILTTPLTLNVDYILSFIYVGQMRQDMLGFYRSSYINQNGEEIWIGSTHFQRTHARSAFPSFDEPKFKATFQLEIIHPNSFIVVSNTAIESQSFSSVSNKIVTKFKETPKMSTYLLAFIVSDFIRRGNRNFSILARSEAYDQTQYAYEIGPKLLKSMEAYADYPFSLQGIGKLELAAIPDFAAGAMENWGLLTYREDSLLYDPRKATVRNRQSIAMTIAHEVAHQWFGNLVTCEWWSYTWLNEGFGRYFQTFLTHEIESSWELEKRFIVDRLQEVMIEDSLPGAWPLTKMSVASPTDAKLMFNSISYTKGASILHMIKAMLGENAFKTALRIYLKTKQYQTAVPQDLFDAFISQWGRSFDISQLFHDWTEQSGYPLVTIQLAKDGNSFLVSQRQFRLYENKDEPFKFWTIPLTYTTNAQLDFENTAPKLFLEKTSSARMVNLTKPAKWIIGNIKESGYYRVNYDENTWQNIRQALGSVNFGGIHELNRAQIVNDVFNLARASIMSYAQAFSILSYLIDEINYLPWSSAFSGLAFLSSRLGVNNREFGDYILKLLSNAYQYVGFEINAKESSLVTSNRVAVLSWACEYGNKDCINKSLKLFDDFVENGKYVEVNIRTVVYCTAIREGDTSNFNFLWEEYRREKDAAEQVLILRALGCSRDKTQIYKYLDLILSNEVRMNNRPSAFLGTLAGQAENVNIVWEYVQENFPKLMDWFESRIVVASTISQISTLFTNQQQRDSLHRLVSENREALGQSSNTLEGAIRNVDVNLEWDKKSIKPLVDYLKMLEGVLEVQVASSGQEREIVKDSEIIQDFGASSADSMNAGSSVFILVVSYFVAFT